NNKGVVLKGNICKRSGYVISQIPDKPPTESILRAQLQKYFTSTPTNEWSYSGYLETIEPYFNNHAKISTLKSTWKKRFNDHLRDLEKDEIDERREVALLLLEWS
ncbi:22475_t:CDS:2, partial [Gigaspora rosea]